MKKFYEVAQEGKEERDGTGPEGTHVRILLHGATDPQQRQLRGLLAGIHCQLVLHGSTKRGDSLLLGGYIARAPKTASGSSPMSLSIASLPLPFPTSAGAAQGADRRGPRG